MKIGIIVLDTLREDIFRAKMDNVMEMSDHVFNRMYSTSRWTVPAHASLFTGNYPTEIGTHSGNQYLTTRSRVLAERLVESGFQTICLSNNTYIDSFFNFDRGFKEFIRGPVLEGRPRSSSGFDWKKTFNELPNSHIKYPLATSKIIRGDAPTITTLIEGLRFAFTSDSLTKTNDIDWVYDELGRLELNSDLFFFANLLMCHSPYTPPEDFFDSDSPNIEPFELTFRDGTIEEREQLWQSYQACAEYLDDALESLIENIDWDLLFVLSDHGELFGEHGLWQHQYGMYQELVHVPAVAYGNLVPAGTTNELTSLLDIHKTILDVADLEDNNHSRGINLFDSSQTREFVYAESTGNYRYSPDAKGLDAKIPESWAKPHYTYIEDGKKYIKDKDGEHIVDLETGSGSTTNFDQLRSRVTDLRQNFDAENVTKPDKEIPDEIHDRLEYLGYK